MKKKSKDTEQPKKIGRPSPMDAIDKEQVRMLAVKGWTDVEMSNFFKVSEKTWNNWKEKHPDFFQSLKAWKEEADARVERSLFERATGYEHKHDEIFLSQKTGQAVVVPTIKHYPPDTTAMIFWLKNRKPGDWRDKQEVVTEHKGSVNLIFKEADGCEPLKNE